ncbi:hypothetical protein B7C42_01656 [Nocardia cerradoensis]|uniref:Uncharacterized protein n=1 Tax=Nocardia cerradoensis TaxID=85688 RepID=A0A231HCP4_9NOCA|nr:hypothetical protein [Nocardia cerradoensis]OXR46681.1 hypothetical protein B7C42_01656 [Nocardia cerradoensis]
MHLPDWHCPTCAAFSILGGEVDEATYELNQRRITAHTSLHTAQLAEHDGDHEALRLRLQNPHHVAAVQSLQTTDERTQQ